MRLQNKVALVTGGTKGIGGGIARVLAEQGAQVFATGRTAADAVAPPGVKLIRCDHSEDSEVEQLFSYLDAQAPVLDILVNAAWGGYDRIIVDGEFTWAKPFWEQPLWRWDSMFQAGVRAYFRDSQLAVRRMLPRQSGLVVNLSHWAAQKHIGNVPYGVSKAATDKLTADMAHELRPHRISVVCLYPGMVRTEKVMESAQWLDLSNSESPEFIGRAVAALASDDDALRHSGKVLVAAALAAEYGFTDTDGTTPRALTLADV